MNSDDECPPPPFDPSAPPKTIIVERLTRLEMIELATSVYDPVGISSEEVTRRLFVLCANCPDPLSAMQFIIELQTEELPMEEVVDRLLAYPVRRIEHIPTSELPSYDPLRGVRLALE